MTPAKIVRIVTRLNIGGPSVHVALLSTRLDPARFATTVVAGAPEAEEGDWSSLIDPARARLVRMPGLRRPLRPWADLMVFARLCRLLWREQPRIVHTHMAKAGALGRLAARAYNRFGPGRRRPAKVVHTFHGHVLEGYFSPATSRFFITIERWLARRTDRLIAVSAAIRDDLARRGIGRPAQWRVIPLGLELAKLSQLPMAAAGAPVRFGVVGRLVPIKNPALFLAAFSRMLQANPRAQASGLIVGDGPLRRSMEREVEQLGLSHVVSFLGWQHDLPRVYGQLEVACVTSWNEGTPVALIEAMAAGRAVVATDVGGVRDVLGGEAPPVDPGGFRVTERGVLVRAGDAEGLTAALRALEADAGLRHRLGAAARAHVLERFAAERLLGDITALYDEWLDGEER
jgi:glycosyltransferase involved in cell wall biosynthesis